MKIDEVDNIFMFESPETFFFYFFKFCVMKFVLNAKFGPNGH